MLQGSDQVETSKRNSRGTVFLLSFTLTLCVLAVFWFLDSRHSTLKTRQDNIVKLELRPNKRANLSQSDTCSTDWLFLITLRFVSLAEAYCTHLQLPTFTLRSRHVRQPLRDRTMLVFLGLGGTGLYIRSRYVVSTDRYHFDGLRGVKILERADESIVADKARVSIRVLVCSGWLIGW